MSVARARFNVALYVHVTEFKESCTSEATVNAAPAPVMERFSSCSKLRAPASVVVYMYPGPAVHTAPAPAVECISQEFTRRTHVSPPNLETELVTFACMYF